MSLLNYLAKNTVPTSEENQCFDLEKHVCVEPILLSVTEGKPENFFLIKKKNYHYLRIYKIDYVHVKGLQKKNCIEVYDNNSLLNYFHFFIVYDVKSVILYIKYYEIHVLLFYKLILLEYALLY